MADDKKDQVGGSQTPATSAPTGVASSTVGVNGPFPAELAGWNWGAFLLNWIWGIGHSVWIALLVLLLGFIPFIGSIGALGLAIYLGIKGNELAWQNRKFESVEQFKAVEKAWTKWAVILLILGIVLGILGFIAFFVLIAASGASTTTTTTSF